MYVNCKLKLVALFLTVAFTIKDFVFKIPFFSTKIIITFYKKICCKLKVTFNIDFFVLVKQFLPFD